MRSCGRELGDDELACSRRLTAVPGTTREAISRQVSEEVGWSKPDPRFRELLAGY